MDASDPSGLPNPTNPTKVLPLPQRRLAVTHEADAASAAAPRVLTVDDVPLLAFARDPDDGVEVPGGVELGFRVGIAHRPPVFFGAQPLPVETTASELRGMWGAGPFVVYLYTLTPQGKLAQPVKQWQVLLDPETERDLGHEPWPFAQGATLPPPVARMHRNREALRERLGSTTPNPFEMWNVGDDDDAPASPYDRADPAHDRYGRDAGSDPRGYDDPRHAHDEGPDSRGYDERAPRSRRELVERDPDAPPASVYLPPGKQWVRTTDGQWLQVDAPGALAPPRRSGFEALLERLSDDPVAALEKIGLAAVALKKVVDIVAPQREPVEDVIARRVERALAPLAEKVAAPPSRSITEVLAEERAKWEADKQAETLAAQLREVQGQLGQMRAARSAPPPPPPKTVVELYKEFEAEAAGLGLVKRTEGSGEAKAPSTLEGVGMLLEGVLNSDVGKTLADSAKPYFDEAAALKRAQREALERNLAPQHPAPQFTPPPQQFSPTPHEIAEREAAEAWAREQLAQRQQQLAAQRAQQMVEQTIVEPRQGHTHAFTHAAHAAPAIAHPAPSPTPEADEDAGEEHSS